jgi:tetratricopeptide (TPR) repeat protein
VAGGRTRSRAGWYIAAAAAAVVVALLFLLPEDTERAAPSLSPPAGAGSGGAAPMGGGSGDGLLSSDMRTNADRLFNRIMTAAEQGDRGQVEQFMPMAIQAYGMVEDLNADGLYHLAILHVTAGEYDEARQAAQRILDGTPGHVLALGVAATAAAEAGDSLAAETMYRRLLDGYDAEAGQPRPEYVDHQPMLAEYRRMAQEFVSDG